TPLSRLFFQWAVTVAASSLTDPNAALTATGVLIVKPHVGFVPLQPPLQLRKPHLGAGVALTVTDVPHGNDTEHVAPQSMPVGVLVTLPSPLFETEKLTGIRLNLATTTRSRLIRTLHDEPLQAFSHPSNVEPSAGFADSATVVQ